MEKNMKKIIIISILSALVLTGCGSNSSGKSSSSSSEAAVTETTAADTNTEPVLTFRMGDAPDGEIILTEKNIVEAKPVYGTNPENRQEVCVSLKLDKEGKIAFADATAEAAQNGSLISIWYNGELISAPKVYAPITDGSAIISGNFDINSATELADKIAQNVPE